MCTNAFGGIAAIFGACANARRNPVGRQNATTSPPDASAVDFRNARRDKVWFFSLWKSSRNMADLPELVASDEFGRAMHRGTDALIRTAAAQIAVHRRIDIGIGG